MEDHDRALTIAELIALLQAEPNQDRPVFCVAEAGQVRTPVLGIYESKADSIELDGAG